MNLKNTCFTLLAVLALDIPSAHAVSIFLRGDLGSVEPDSSGSLDIIVDTAPGGETFQSGGIDLAVSSSTPGVIAFTGAEVNEPVFFGFDGNRWASRLVVPSASPADGYDLLRGIALNSIGLSAQFLSQNADGGSPSSFLFATIGYDVIGAGTTNIELSPASGTDSFVQEGNIVSDVQLSGGSITVIPEPTAMALAGLGLVVFTTQRRSG